MLMLAPPNDNPGPNNKTIDQQLADAKADLVTRQTAIDTLTRERDTAQTELQASKDEVTRLNQQFEAATKEATDSKAEVTRLKDEVTKITGERDTAKTSLNTSNGHVTRLESLCRVKGIPTTAAVPADNSASGEGKPTLDELAVKMAAAKTPMDQAAVLAEIQKHYGPKPPAAA